MHLDAIYSLAPQAAREHIDYLICEVLGLKRAELLFAEEPSAPKLLILQEYLQRLNEGLPPQYITGTACFYGLDFAVDKTVLIPRFDTEVLVEALLKYLSKQDRVLDIGTGSGAIAITLKYLMPSLEVHATDICEAALNVARGNALRHQSEITFHLADLFPPAAEPFQAIVSNPPYISPAEYQTLDRTVRDYEPQLALKADEEGYHFYSRILHEAGLYLDEGGILALEHGNTQQERVLRLTEKAGFRTLEKGKDLAQRDRYLILQKRG